jgi:hypothetical protein
MKNSQKLLFILSLFCMQSLHALYLYKQGQAPTLHAAVGTCDPESIKNLLAAGANIKHRDKKARTALELAKDQLESDQVSLKDYEKHDRFAYEYLGGDIRQKLEKTEEIIALLEQAAGLIRRSKPKGIKQKPNDIEWNKWHKRSLLRDIESGDLLSARLHFKWLKKRGAEISESDEYGITVWQHAVSARDSASPEHIQGAENILEYLKEQGLAEDQGFFKSDGDDYKQEPTPVAHSQEAVARDTQRRKKPKTNFERAMAQGFAAAISSEEPESEELDGGATQSDFPEQLLQASTKKCAQLPCNIL